LRRESEASTPSAVEPVCEFAGEVTAEWDQANSPFTWTDAKKCSVNIDVNQTQAERFADPQSGAIQNQEQHPQSRQPQEWSSEAVDVFEQGFDLSP
jgi:hypothetical protein